MSSARWPFEIPARELARALEAGEPVQVVDVRAPGRVATGRIELVPPKRFHNVVGSQLSTWTTLEGGDIRPDLPTAVVCGRGNDSRRMARHLNELGCQASSLEGGMAAWMNLTIPRELEAPASLDRLIQFDRVGKGALGYLLVSDGEAVIVDPPRDAEAYLAAARDLGARVVGITDTHVHADYISGAPELSRRLGVPYYLHPADAISPYDGVPGRLEFQPLEDGGTIRCGRSTIVARHTPGHTEGSLTFLVDDQVALTGDFVFVGSIGRPDLAGKVEAWTKLLWKSLERAKREWPAELAVYPAHYGAESERSDDRSIGARFGELLETNAALRHSDSEKFAAWVCGSASSFPEAYRTIKGVNIELVRVSEQEAEELEVGKNECALGGG